ncbi:uncharacterized protein N7458_008885 [Penicillium daleae]|uniref:NB-ARC domain-containing protein n=1 Tax=Penicillium daleae TaxID=63821 RepID=A0AAD6BXK9_9EURO|nr:uncharacterized protein N7458_008885 [Penicillium daleae]KAJ5437887.1 hypothetical protein N7458_008885 [Penicillium daleae]
MAFSQTTEGTSISGFNLIYPTPSNTETKKPLQLPCILLNTYSANKDFCGREDILELLATELLPSKSTATASGSGLRQFALYGFRGIGKTEIARKFSRRHKTSFDAVFWVTADEIAKLDHHYQEISLALGLEDPAECNHIEVDIAAPTPLHIRCCLLMRNCQRGVATQELYVS